MKYMLKLLMVISYLLRSSTLSIMAICIEPMHKYKVSQLLGPADCTLVNPVM